MANLLLETPEAERFTWVNSGEPHCMRRRAILAKYGAEIRKLYGYDHATAWQMISVTLLQMYMAWLVQDWSWPALLVAAYFISGTANQNLLTGQHEISHFLAFRRPVLNKALALFSNLVLVVPVAVKFREYHHDHHIFLGIDGGDVDLPTVLEASWVTNLGAKVLWGLVYLIVYGVRPLLVRPKPPTRADAVNWATTIGFDLLVLYFWGFKSVLYLVLGTLLGGSLLHPMGGHLLAEHYVFENGQETYSYYGPMNALTYNVGLHNEHHDFPQIPHTRLYRLRQIAPEFYEPMYQHHSWCWVLWQFFADAKVGPWKRVHRLERHGNPAQNARFLEHNGFYAVHDGAPTPREVARATLAAKLAAAAGGDASPSGVLSGPASPATSEGSAATPDSAEAEPATTSPSPAAAGFAHAVSRTAAGRAALRAPAAALS